MRCTLLLIGCCLPVSVMAQEGKPERFTHTVILKQQDLPDLDPRHFIFSPETVFDADQHLRLAGSVLLSHETGATDHHQAEPLSATTWAKVRFAIDVPPLSDGELFFFGSAKEVLLNNEALEPAAKLISTGWSRVKVPAGKLRRGDNEVILRGGGSLLVEPGRAGQSFKTSDGGRTWSADQLTKAGDVAGEYLVRLRLPQHARKGWAMTRLIDLWSDAPLPTPRLVEEVALTRALPAGGGEPFPGKQPDKTSVKAFFRLGDTRSAGDKTWTGWNALDGVKKLDG